MLHMYVHTNCDCLSLLTLSWPNFSAHFTMSQKTALSNNPHNIPHRNHY